MKREDTGSCETMGHCWHVTHVTSTYPSTTEETCCWCGTKRDAPQRIPTRTHGAHAPGMVPTGRKGGTKGGSR